jgi:hypothetical protein
LSVTTVSKALAIAELSVDVVMGKVGSMVWL